MKATFICRTPAIVERITHAVRHVPLDPPHEIIIRPWKKPRSLAANRLYWLWVGLIRDHLRESTGQVHHAEDVHVWLAGTFLPMRAVEIDGQAVHARTSTATLTAREFAEYLEQVDAYCVDRLGLVLPHPDDLYHEAMAARLAPLSATAAEAGV